MLSLLLLSLLSQRMILAGECMPVDETACRLSKKHCSDARAIVWQSSLPPEACEQVASWMKVNVGTDETNDPKKLVGLLTEVLRRATDLDDDAFAPLAKRLNAIARDVGVTAPKIREVDAGPSRAERQLAAARAVGTAKAPCDALQEAYCVSVGEPMCKTVRILFADSGATPKTCRENAELMTKVLAVLEPGDPRYAMLNGTLLIEFVREAPNLGPEVADGLEKKLFGR